MSNNLDNLLSDIYSSESQSQGVKELAVLINNLSNLLLKSISQLESRVLKLEQTTRGGAAASSPLAPATTPAPKPKAASPFKPATPVKRTPPPPQQRATPVTATGGEPSSAAQAASMLGATLKPAPKKTASPAANGSGPSFLTGVVSPDARQTSPSTASTAGGPAITIDAAAPASTGGEGIAGPRGGFKGELAEKLARRRAKVQQQLEDDFDAPDLSETPEEEIIEEEAPSSELKTDLEDELRNAFSKLKG